MTKIAYALLLLLGACQGEAAANNTQAMSTRIPASNTISPVDNMSEEADQPPELTAKPEITQADEASEDAAYYAAASPFAEFRVRAQDAEGTEYGDLTMGDIFDTYGGQGYTGRFEMAKDGPHLFLTKGATHLDFWFDAYGQLGEGFRLSRITANGEVISQHGLRPWANSPDARLINGFDLQPKL